jgi:DNA-binding LacI/PurR family transcriptional regulator
MPPRLYLEAMLHPPQRLSLVAQTVAILQEHIASCRGGEKLASERELCHQLGVSRLTLRSALANLARDGFLHAGQGRRRVITVPGPGARQPTSSRDVVVLSPLPLQGVDPRVLFWIDELRDALAKENYRLDFVNQRNCYSEYPERALEELAARLRPAVWLLHLSTHTMQQWFFAQGLPAVIPGSRYEGVRLPSVDVDYRATCQHAVGRFLAKGHRCLALLNPKSSAAGDIESEAGFRQAGAVAGSGVETLIAQHDGTVAGICACLDRLLARTRPPTAFLVSRPTHALTALGHLIQRGLRFPKEAAFIARDHDSFLEHAVPTPARYQVDAVLFAHKMSRIVLEMASGGDARSRDYRVTPRLISGETLG